MIATTATAAAASVLVAIVLKSGRPVEFLVAFFDNRYSDKKNQLPLANPAGVIATTAQVENVLMMLKSKSKSKNKSGS